METETVETEAIPPVTQTETTETIEPSEKTEPLAVQPEGTQTSEQASVEAQKTQLQATKVRGLFRIESIIEETLWLKALFYGQWGAGKTTLGASADKVEGMRDVLFINAESGTLSLRKEFPHLDAIRINNFAQFAQIHNYLRLHVRARDEANDAELRRLEAIVRGTDPETIKVPKHYRTVVIDSLSEVQRYCMMQILGIQLESIQLDYPPESPVYQAWGQSSEMIQNLVRAFRDLAMNVIFICSQKDEQDEAKRYHFKPNLPGKLAGNVQGFLDVVGYLAMIPPTAAEVAKATQEGKLLDYKRRLGLTPTPYFDAKNRIGNKTQYIDNPTIEKLLASS